MNISSRISDLIFEKRITQKQLAEDLNLAPSTINGYIKKQREPDIETLQKLADYFDISIDYLVCYNRKMVTPTGRELNDKENELLNIYRCLKSEQQDFLIEQAKFLINQNVKKTGKSSATILRTGIGKNK